MDLDFKKMANGFAEDSNEIFKDIKKKAFKEKNKNSSDDDDTESVSSKSSKASDSSNNDNGDVIVNITDSIKKNVSEQFNDLTKATSSTINNLTNGLDNAKNFSPDKMFSGIVKNIWKEDDKFLGLTISRGQKIVYSLSFVFASVLFLGIDVSLLLIDHVFENLKYSIFFLIWTLCFLLGIRILDSAVPEQFFEKKSKTIRLVAVTVYSISLIGCVTIANIIDSWTVSLVAFCVHFASLAWLTTTHIPTFKGINFSYFAEKSPLLFSSFYNRED